MWFDRLIFASPFSILPQPSLKYSQNIQNIIPFEDPAPARERSMIYSKSQLKLPVINALMSNISSVIRGQIKYNDIKIVSPASV